MWRSQRHLLRHLRRHPRRGLRSPRLRIIPLKAFLSHIYLAKVLPSERDTRDAEAGDSLLICLKLHVFASMVSPVCLFRGGPICTSLIIRFYQRAPRGHSLLALHQFCWFAFCAAGCVRKGLAWTELLWPQSFARACWNQGELLLW